MIWLKIARECQRRSLLPGECFMSLQPLDLGWSQSHPGVWTAELHGGLTWPQSQHGHQHVSDTATVVSTALSARRLVGIKKVLLDIAQSHSLGYYSTMGNQLDFPPFSLRLWNYANTTQCMPILWKLYFLLFKKTRSFFRDMLTLYILKIKQLTSVQSYSAG